MATEKKRPLLCYLLHAWTKWTVKETSANTVGTFDLVERQCLRCKDWEQKVRKIR